MRNDWEGEACFNGTASCEGFTHLTPLSALEGGEGGGCCGRVTVSPA